MSYDQSYKGSFRYADAHCLEAALDGFSTAGDDRESSVLEMDDLEIEGLAVKFSWNGSAPASSSFGTGSAINRLAEFARSGSARSTYEGDGAQVTRAEGRRSAEGLPPPHHRWELFLAARSGSVQALRALQGRDISVDMIFSGFHGYTSLHLAARSGSAEAVRFLLDAGCAPDRRNRDDGPTPLAIARSAEVVKVLLGAGADPDVIVHESRPIEIACRDAEERPGVILALLEAGATLPSGAALVSMLQDCAGAGALDVLMAIADRHPRVNESLRHEDVIAAAVSTGKPVLVDYLLEQGAELPATFFADAADAGAVELLRPALAAPGAARRCGKSATYSDPMVAAAREGHLEVLQLLAAAGVPLSPTAAGPEATPLHSAVCGSDRNLPCIRWLLAQGVPVSVRNDDGNTALALACSIGSSAAIRLLLEHGADPAEVTDEGDRKRLEKIAPAAKRKQKATKTPVTKKKKPPATRKPVAKKK